MPVPASSPPDSADTTRRFQGVGKAYGEPALARFRASHVCVVGLGGVGSWAVEALARSAVGQLTLIDLDHVCESNVNRQLHAIEPDFGRAKAQALAARIAAINPACRVRTVEDFVTPDNVAELLAGPFDWVIDCIDGARAKAAVIAHCRYRRQKLVTVGGAGGRTDPGQVRTADLSRAIHDPLLGKTRRLLRERHGFPRRPGKRLEVACVYSLEQARPPAGVCAPGGLNCAGGLGSAVVVTAAFGLAAAGHVLNKLAAGIPARP